MVILYIQNDSRTAILLLCSALNGKTETVQALFGDETNVNTSNSDSSYSHFASDISTHACSAGHSMLTVERKVCFDVGCSKWPF